MKSTSGNILEDFLMNHSLVCNQLGRFSFFSQTFRPEDKKGAKSSTGYTGQGSLTSVIYFWGDGEMFI